MVIYILYVFVYIFFIYGVLEFIKNTYIGFNIPKNTRPIKIIIENNNDLEYTILNIKNKFSPIRIYVDNENEEIVHMIEVLKDDYNIIKENIEELK